MMIVLTLLLLIVLAAFFSLAETGMMAANRYRLRHLSRKSHSLASRALKLLERPDRLLGVIAIGSTFATICASSIAAMLAVQWFGDIGVLYASVVLTLIILIFAETAPKTVAAIYSERVALLVTTPLSILLKLFYPLVWFINLLANGTLRLFGIRISTREIELLSIEELRSIVCETTGKTTSNYQEMLLRVLDMQKITVEEIMVPKNEIYGIDLTQDWDTIVMQLTQSSHHYLFLYREHVENVEGMLNLRRALIALRDPRFDKAALLALTEEIYFIPEGTLLHQQLLNFQQNNQEIGLVVDEYGDIQGVLTLSDLLEEIAGDFAANTSELMQLFSMQEDGSVLVDGSISVRDLNRLTHWHLPLNYSRTLSGLIIQYLEGIPTVKVSVRIAGYPMEVLSVSHNTIERVCVWPALYSSK